MEFSGAVIDVDGTVVRGDDPIPGAPEGYRRIREAGIDTLFVSNNPTKAPPAYVDRLGSAGYDVGADRVITAGTGDGPSIFDDTTATTICSVSARPDCSINSPTPDSRRQRTSTRRTR